VLFAMQLQGILFPLTGLGGGTAFGWSLYIWLVLVPALILNVLLLLNRQTFKEIGCKLLDKKLGPNHMNIATFMVAGSILFGFISFAGVQRYQVRALERMQFGDTYGQNQNFMNYFHESRNFFMCVMGVVLWCIAARLKVLHRTGCLIDPEGLTPRSAANRLMWVAIAVACFAVADVPLSRINYNLQLMTYVTPIKDRLLAGPALECPKVYMHTCAPDQGGSQQCENFCAEVKTLAETRLDTILFVRRWHVMGRIAAQFFDNTRGVEQGNERIDALFKKKTCAGVLGSVDKSNQFVNAVCITSAFVALLMFITAVGNACSAGETIIAEAVPVPAAAPADAAQPQGLHQD